MKGFGSAKESSNVSESSGDSSWGMTSSNGSSSSVGAPESSSDSAYVIPGNGSEGSSSSSSSCQCGFEVSEITLTSAMEGSYVITNTGCGVLTIIRHEQVADFISSYSGTVLEEGQSTTVTVAADEDIRLTNFIVVTDCRSQTFHWPDW
jgi:hypothetical protein